MARRIWVIFLGSVLLCAGCSMRRSEDVGWPVVSRITVTCDQGGSMTQQVYTSQHKMRQILNQLRTLGQQFTPPIDPEALSARTYSISVSFTDGTQRLYQTKSDRYIRIDQHPWQQADPKRIEDLNQLLQSLPGD